MRAALGLVLAATACSPKLPPLRSAPTPAAAAGPVSGLDWANGSVFYEIFVRSFVDSNGDGIGDLSGLISRLDTLNDGDPATTNDLGVDALWLMPVFGSPSYHGYDTTDYENIDPDYGTNQDFERLMTEAHRRGIKVVVDLVLNHSSNQHPWFLDSASSPTSPKRDWYVWSPTDLGWGQPWNAASPTWHSMNGAFYYGVFWRGMPDLNFKNPEVREEAKRIAALWLKRGVDGFRLDATRHLIETGPGDDGQNDTAETHAFLKEFAAFVRETKPEAVLIGENWTETSIIARYFGDTAAVAGGDQLQLNFDFPLAGKIIAAARQGEASLVATKIVEMQAAYPAGATWVPFLTNHDMKRVASDLENDQAKLRSAAAVLLTLPGTPFLYYGEEVGLLNGPGDQDESKRTPMPWDASEGGGFTAGKPWRPFSTGRDTANVAAQTNDPGSLLSHYRKLIQARHASPALRRGKLELLATEGSILAYLLTGEAERVLVAHNLGDTPHSAPLLLVGIAEITPLYVDAGATIAEGAGSVSLPAHGSGIWRLK